MTKFNRWYIASQMSLFHFCDNSQEPLYVPYNVIDMNWDSLLEANIAVTCIMPSLATNIKEGDLIHLLYFDCGNIAHYHPAIVAMKLSDIRLVHQVIHIGYSHDNPVELTVSFHCKLELPVDDNLYIPRAQDKQDSEA